MDKADNQAVKIVCKGKGNSLEIKTWESPLEMKFMNFRRCFFPTLFQNQVQYLNNGSLES